MMGKTAGSGITELQTGIAELCRSFGLAELYVFGSRANEFAPVVGGSIPAGAEAMTASDIDIGIRPLLGVQLSARDLVELTAALESRLGVPRVDVVLLPTASPFLALEIIRGELLYCADPDAQAEYELYVLRRAGDLAPFQRFRQKLALSRYGTGPSSDTEP